MALPDLTNYLVFVQVAEAGSISEAARELGMPKSTISRRLTELEKAQGVRLMHRSTRGLKLTDIGRAFLVHCQAMVAAAEAADQVTQVAQETPRGTVNISAPYAVSQSFLAFVMPEFMKRYPEVLINLTVTNRPVNLVDEGIDIALRVRATIEDSSFIAREITKSPSTIYASPELLEKHGGQPTEPFELTGFPHVSLHYSSGRYGYELTHKAGRKMSVSTRPRLITDDMVVLKQALLAGEGIGSLPNYICAEEIEQGKLVRVLPEWSQATGIMHMVYPHRSGLLPAVRVTIDFLAERLPEVARELMVIHE